MGENIVSRIALVVCILCYLYAGESFTTFRNIGRHSTAYHTALSATKGPKRFAGAVSIVKKGKKKMLDSLRKEMEEQGSEHPITKFLETGERPFLVEQPLDFRKVTRNGGNTLSIFAEYNKKATTGFIIGLPPPEIMGGVLRDANARAIIVSMDSRTGGATPKEFERFAREQAKARLFLPGPIPIVWNDLVVDKLQIAHAAALGAAAITISPTLCDDLQDYIDYCGKLKIQPMGMARDADEANALYTAGVRYLCLQDLEQSALIELRKKLPSATEDPELQVAARLRAEADYSTNAEIDSCWHLRDNGFAAVWPSAESVFATGMTDIYSTITAMRSKASQRYISPRQFLMDRKNEGAKEYLGDILY